VTLVAGPAAVVVDASVAVRFVSGEPPWIERWRGWVDGQALLLVPPHFPAEVANALLRSVRLPALDAAARLERLSATGIEIADRGWAGVPGALELAAKHRLSVYDALYLDLAIDVDAELATLDRTLARAARSEGLAVTA
jgi:predicted nucleic acid-binding protein